MSTVKKINIMSIFLFLIYSLSAGQIKLGGEQEGVFDSSTYIVSNDLIVPLGKKLEFLPNTRLLFLPFVEIKVDGQLKMKNAWLSPKDSAGNWNGIEVGLNGRIHLENVTIHRSVTGVGVPDSRSIQHFSNITFTGSKSTLRIDNDPVFIREGKPYTYGGANLNERNIENHQFTSNRLLNNDVKKKPSIRAGKWISAITALTCIAGCIISIEESNRKYNQYHDQSKDPVKAQEYRKQSLVYKNIAIGTGIGAGVSGVALSVCLAINHKKD